MDLKMPRRLCDPSAGDVSPHAGARAQGVAGQVGERQILHLHHAANRA
jgi:hypothetical protein